MKKNLLLTIAFSCTVALANAQMRVSGNGNVTLQSTDVVGSLRVSGGIDGMVIGDGAEPAIGNDSETAHDKLSALTAVPFYKSVPAGQAKSLPLGSFEAQSLSKLHYALSAEQLGAVYPDLVYVREDGTKGINYMEMIPLLVQAIGELSAKVEALEAVSGRQQRSMAKAVAGIDSGEALPGPGLGQNSPNPFASTTEIGLTIPDDAHDATLCIYDMTGKQLRQLPVSGRGKTSVVLTGEGLASGMYLYSLIIDGKLIDTKRMVFAK